MVLRLKKQNKQPCTISLLTNDYLMCDNWYIIVFFVLQKSSKDPYDVRQSHQMSPPQSGRGVSDSDMSEFDFCDDAMGKKGFHIHLIRVTGLTVVLF